MAADNYFFNFDQIQATGDVWSGETNRIYHTPHLTLMTFSAEKGHTFNDPGHVNEQITIVYKGELKLTVGGQTKTMRANDVAVIPPWVPHSGLVTSDTVEGLDIFAPPRTEERYGTTD